MSLETHHLDLGRGVQVALHLDPEYPGPSLTCTWTRPPRRRHIKHYSAWMRSILQTIANRNGQRIAYCLRLSTGENHWIRIEPEQ